MSEGMVLNKRDKGIVLRALYKLKSIGPVRNGMGICYNLRHRSTSRNFGFYCFVRYWSVGWEHHSGNPSFPIPRKAYRNSDAMWTDRAGELRYNLIDYLIKKVEDS